MHFVVKLPFWSLGIFTLESYVVQTHKTVFLYIKGKLKTIVVPLHIEDIHECSCFIEFIKRVGEKR